MRDERAAALDRMTEALGRLEPLFEEISQRLERLEHQGQTFSPPPGHVVRLSVGHMEMFQALNKKLNEDGLTLQITPISQPKRV